MVAVVQQRPQGPQESQGLQEPQGLQESQELPVLHAAPLLAPLLAQSLAAPALPPQDFQQPSLTPLAAQEVSRSAASGLMPPEH
jgi:hypothetical protein